MVVGYTVEQSMNTVLGFADGKISFVNTCVICSSLNNIEKITVHLSASSDIVSCRTAPVSTKGSALEDVRFQTCRVVFDCLRCFRRLVAIPYNNCISNLP